MSRMHFDFRDATEFLPDEEGIELRNLKSARTQIVRALEELRVEEPDLAREGSGWRLEVSDSSGTVLLSISLDALTVRQRRRALH
jgi:hypothetical protein